MANCIAKAAGEDSSRTKSVHRLGSRAAYVQAATWHTFAEAYVTEDGSGSITVRRGRQVFTYEFGAQSGKLPGARHARLGVRGVAYDTRRYSQPHR